MTLRVEPFAAALRDIADALDRSGIKWAVAGAVAANRYRDETRVRLPFAAPYRDRLLK